jgi:hypothetical protein
MSFSAAKLSDLELVADGDFSAGPAGDRLGGPTGERLCDGSARALNRSLRLRFGVRGEASAAAARSRSGSSTASAALSGADVSNAEEKAGVPSKS